MKDLIYKVEYQPCDAVFKLLKETVYGTKGVKINHRDTDKKLPQLFAPEFHMLWKDADLLAVAIYCKRRIMLQTEEIDAYYIRYFSVNNSYQNQGLGKRLTSEIEAYYKRTITQKTVFYAYIEEKNVRSLGVSKHFTPKLIGTMKTLFFSRFFPKMNSKCSVASGEDLIQIRSLLDAQLINHTTVFLDRIGYEDSYYIYKEGDEIIAGVQLINTKWKLYGLPGVLGWLSLYLFPYIPVLNRIADGRNVKFSGVEAVFCEKGKENELLTLLEHTFAETGNYKAFLYFDEKENLYQTLKVRKDLGFMSRVQKSPSVRIIEQSFFLDKAEEKYLASSLKYISAFDIT